MNLLLGKRCKYATKYRSGDEIKDCGKYCKKNCKSWFGGLITSIFKGSLIANGEVRDKIYISIHTFDFHGIFHGLSKTKNRLEYIADEYGKTLELDNKNISLISDIFCEGLKDGSLLTIEVKIEDIGIINDLEIGGIRGWNVEHNEHNQIVRFIKEIHLTSR